LLLTVLHSASLLAPPVTDSARLTFKLTYNFSIFAASEFEKDFKKRSLGEKNGSFELNSDELTDTWKAQLLRRILGTTIEPLRRLVILVYFIQEDKLVRTVLSHLADVVNAKVFLSEIPGCPRVLYINNIPWQAGNV
jgi:hypothetical protein